MKSFHKSAYKRLKLNALNIMKLAKTPALASSFTAIEALKLFPMMIVLQQLTERKRTQNRDRQTDRQRDRERQRETER